MRLTNLSLPATSLTVVACPVIREGPGMSPYHCVLHVRRLLQRWKAHTQSQPLQSARLASTVIVDQCCDGTQSGPRNYCSEAEMNARAEEIEGLRAAWVAQLAELVAKRPATSATGNTGSEAGDITEAD